MLIGRRSRSTPLISCSRLYRAPPITALQNWLKRTQAQIHLLISGIATLESLYPFLSDPSSISDKEDPKAIVREIRCIANGTSKFQSNTAPDEFWETFEYVCSSHYLNTVESVLLLNLLVADNQVARIWFRNALGDKIQTDPKTIVMSEVKKSFYEQFLSKDWKLIKFQELLEIRYRQAETVREFTNRFSSKMSENEFDVHSQEPDTVYLKSILF